MAKKIEFKIDDGGEDFPEVLADPIRLDEVMNNLVSNAIKHSPEGGKITIRQCKPDAEHLRVSVIDEGPGVPDGGRPRHPRGVHAGVHV